MSAPIQNRDKLDPLQLYAPSRAREQPAAQASPVPAAAEPVAAAPVTLAASTPVAAAPAAAPSLADAVERVAQSAMQLRHHAEDSAAELRPAELEGRGPLSAPDAPSAKPVARMAQGIGGPNLEWRQSRVDLPSLPARVSPFEGDIAVKALRHRLSLDPELVPEPPVRERHKAIMPLLGRLGLVMVVASVVSYGITLITIPELRPLSLKKSMGVADTTEGLNVNRSASGTEQMPVRLIIEGRRAFANEPLSLGVSLNGATGSEFALLTGLAAGTRLSVGNAFGNNGWRLAARDLGSAFAYAPRDFVGVMDAAIDVRSSSDLLVDRNVMRLEWIGKPMPPMRPPAPAPTPRMDRDEVPPPAAATPAAIPVIQPIDPEELMMLLRRGQEYLRNGDIAAARLVLRRAANAGNAQAALTLGATFDPIVFGEMGVLGFAADPAQARAWYERAGQLGSPEAARRIERLTRVR